MMSNFVDMTEKIILAKLRLLKMHYDKKIGHTGGNLSCIDSLMVLHHNVMNKKDKFVLSKAYSAGVLYFHRKQSKLDPVDILMYL